MNDIIDASVITEEIEPIIEDGQIDTTGELESETPEEEQEFFDFTEVGEKFVKLQVDGQEVSVSIKEALAGYQRQADYTRKTQELSEQRKQVQFATTLQQSLQDDPANTLAMLQQHYGKAADPVEEEWLDDNEKQFRSLEQRIAAFESDKALSDLTKTIEVLQSKYGEDFNADEVIAKAMTTGSTDLEAIFKQIAFDKVYTKAAEANKKLTEEQGRIQAKRQATIVSSGSGSKGPVKSVVTPPKSVFEAFEAAKKTLNL